MSEDKQGYLRLNYKQWLCYIGALVFILAIPLWLYFIAPYFKKIPNNFSYTANTLSFDNFFDIEANKFQGEHISKTTFSYRVVDVKPNYLVIENIFDVRTLSDKPIISVIRYYYIDPYTSKHVSVAQKEQRSGYLFGPSYANKNKFTYWHVNYNAPAELQFIDKEKIAGLTVNHYEANYKADQTANLTYLPDVPEKKGIVANVKLQLWIEPISGWLVKYQDDTLAYYYDQKTKQQLSLWNKFSNSYTQNSINQQVKIATLLKYKILTIDFGVPILFAIIALSLLWCAIRNITAFGSYLGRVKDVFSSKKNLIFNLFCIALFAMIAWSLYSVQGNKDKPRTYTVAIAQWNNSVDIAEIIRGFKDGLAESGIKGNINYVIKDAHSNVRDQIAIIQTFIDQKVDLIFTLTTPGTLVAKGMTNDIPIVFSDVIYPVEAEIISSLRFSKNNLVGTRNYIPAARQFNAFEKIYPDIKTLGFVHHKGDPDSEIQYSEYKSMLNKRGIVVIDVAAIDANDLREQIEKYHYDAIFLACDTLMQEGGGKAAIDYSQQKKIPIFSCDSDNVRKGSLLSYSPNLYQIGKLAGKKAGLILQGAEPSWLYTVGPKQGDLIINMHTARELGITIPTEMLKQAKEIIDN